MEKANKPEGNKSDGQRKETNMEMKEDKGKGGGRGREREGGREGR